jgi:aromatic ring-opening dioxygenase catalytic subunit (LigB family)
MDPPAGSPHMWDGLAAYLRGIDRSLGVRPKAALVISGHWETPLPTLNVAAKPGLLFDYYGFPEHTYRLKYPAAGAPQLAEGVRQLLGDAGFKTDVESRRGLDHGVFVPFLLIYPNADVPMLQLSLQAGLDPALHMSIGRALAPLRDQGVLIVGSGMSYHNLADMFSGRGEGAAAAFDAWLGSAAGEVARSAGRGGLAPARRASHPVDGRGRRGSRRARIPHLRRGHRRQTNFGLPVWLNI